MADEYGLLSDPWLNMGMGLLAKSIQQPRPVNIGEALLGGMGQAGKAVDMRRLSKKEKADEETRKMQQQIQQMQLQKSQQEMADKAKKDAWFSGMPSFITSPEQQAVQQSLAQGGGPTNANAATLSALQPQLASAQPQIDMIGYLKWLQTSPDPDDRNKAITTLAAMNKPTIQSVKADEEIISINPTTGKKSVIHTGGSARPLEGYLVRDATGNWVADPKLLAAAKELKATSAPRTTISTNIENKAESAGAVELAKLDAKQVDQLREQALGANNAKGNIQQMKKAVDGGIYSGTAASWRVQAANFFSTLGVPVDAAKLSNSQQYEKYSKELTLAALKQAMGSSQLSNTDRDFVDATVPKLETDPAARIALLDYMEKRANETISRYQNADEHFRSNKSLKGFNLFPTTGGNTPPTGKINPAVDAALKKYGG